MSAIDARFRLLTLPGMGGDDPDPHATADLEREAMALLDRMAAE